MKFEPKNKYKQHVKPNNTYDHLVIFSSSPQEIKKYIQQNKTNKEKIKTILRITAENGMIDIVKYIINDLKFDIHMASQYGNETIKQWCEHYNRLKTNPEENTFEETKIKRNFSHG